MPVDTKHKDYNKRFDQWERCRHVIEGQDAVHAEGEKYLFRLKAQTNEDYEAYKQRATFFNATWRTIAALTGMMFRRPPIINAPDAALPMFADVTQSGMSMESFLTNVATEALSVGRVGVLVDYPRADVDGMTLADAIEMNMRPQMSLYRAESIINWREETRNNRRVLSLVVLAEKEYEPLDEFEGRERDTWRVLDLDERGFYRQRLFTRVGAEQAESGFALIDEAYPLMNGAPMKEIPFFFVGTEVAGAEAFAPPLIDLVDLNLAHYRAVASYEHGCHFTGVPTGYIIGHKAEPGERFYLGSQHMLVFSRPEVRVGFLEFSGAGLSTLERNIASKEAQMAVLGARMLEAPKRAAEAAETAAIYRSGEMATLSGVSRSIAASMTQALKAFVRWAGLDDSDSSVELTSDFLPTAMSQGELTNLIAAWQQGAISYETLFRKMKQADVVPFDANEDDERDRILDNPPDLPTPSKGEVK